MYSLNLPYLNLLTIKNSISLLFCLFLFACSSTEQVNNEHFINNGYYNGFIKDNFSHTKFTLTDNKTIKKTLHSDHQLAMSLLNRPIPADQAMMLAFEQERVNYTNSFLSYTVEIKGDKSSEKSGHRANNPYKDLISQDWNSVNISAPN